MGWRCPCDPLCLYLPLSPLHHPSSSLQRPSTLSNRLSNTYWATFYKVYSIIRHLFSFLLTTSHHGTYTTTVKPYISLLNAWFVDEISGVVIPSFISFLGRKTIYSKFATISESQPMSPHVLSISWFLSTQDSFMWGIISHWCVYCHGALSLPKTANDSTYQEHR